MVIPLREWQETRKWNYTTFAEHILSKSEPKKVRTSKIRAYNVSLRCSNSSQSKLILFLWMTSNCINRRDCVSEWMDSDLVRTCLSFQNYSGPFRDHFERLTMVVNSRFLQIGSVKKNVQCDAIFAKCTDSRTISYNISINCIVIKPFENQFEWS